MYTVHDITVCIPTIEERNELLQEALQSVYSQTAGLVKVMSMLDVDRKGPAWVRNRMVEKVDTPWVQFLDDDDVIHSNFLERILPHLEEGDVVYSWPVEQGFSGHLDRPFNPDIMRQCNMVPVTACVNVEMFRDVGGFTEDAIYEDWGLWLKLMDVGARFVCVQEKLWTYRLHGGSRTHWSQRRIAAGESAIGSV